uniref:Saposin B-type domain-containing protein n=1 Tax=Panagrolaimus sp. PS1159 TaxID=55785 RepID=A0AC35FY14_9BILA
MNAVGAVFYVLIFIGIAMAQDDYCGTCRKMIIELREEFNDDFQKVSIQRIVDALNGECKIEMPGFPGQICKSKVNANACKLLRILRKGATNEQACKALQFCN